MIHQKYLFETHKKIKLKKITFANFSEKFTFVQMSNFDQIGPKLCNHISLEDHFHPKDFFETHEKVK